LAACTSGHRKEQTVPSETIVIKRYGGERLYDTGAARYVSLSDIAELVRAERSVRIHEAASGEDITAAILTRVVAGRH
jgi:polyhydroxyalkanoate synthesis regulator protein